MSRERNIDCMKYRKSTHLAGVDVESIIAEKGECILTINEVFYEENVNVSGNKTNGYFIEFSEDVKPMIVNSKNKNAISNIVRNIKGLDRVEGRNIGNWKGVKIELYFDPNVKMMGKVTGGIRVKEEPVVLKKKSISDVNFNKALEAIKNGTYTKDRLLSDYELTQDQKSKL